MHHSQSNFEDIEDYISFDRSETFNKNELVFPSSQLPTSSLSIQDNLNMDDHFTSQQTSKL